MIQIFKFNLLLNSVAMVTPNHTSPKQLIEFWDNAEYRRIIPGFLDITTDVFASIPVPGASKQKTL